MLFYLKVSGDYRDYNTVGCLYYGASNMNLRAAGQFCYGFFHKGQAEREMRALRVRRIL